MRSQRRLALMGRVLLVVSLWNAPLPMVHAHGTDVVDSTDSAHFVEHLADYHPDVTLNSHVDFGWHWHLVPPHENHSGTSCPDGHHSGCPCQDCDTPFVASLSVTSAAMILTGAEVTGIVNAIQAIDVALFQGDVVSTRYLETYLGSVSLGTLLRVSRC